MINLMDNVRMFGPKAADHWSVGTPCPACNEPFVAGDFTTLVTIGPGRNREAQAKAAAGRAYNATAIEAHWECVTGVDPKTVVSES